jgi:starvation-inducible DNA-binding protein
MSSPIHGTPVGPAPVKSRDFPVNAAPGREARLRCSRLCRENGDDHLPEQVRRDPDPPFRRGILSFIHGRRRPNIAAGAAAVTERERVVLGIQSVREWRSTPYRPFNLAHRGIVMAMSEAKKKELKGRRAAPLVTPSDLGAKASTNIAGGMNAILADVWALYLKTKNFHWHMSGPHFRDYHLLLDEQADQLYAMSDPIAERIRKVGGSTLRSIGHIARLQRVKDNDADYVDPLDMLAELREDNQSLAARLREVHDVVDEARDIATASLIENWIDETERRTWFLFEASRKGP